MLGLKLNMLVKGALDMERIFSLNKIWQNREDNKVLNKYIHFTIYSQKNTC